MSGWIKLHRGLKTKALWDFLTADQFKVFIHLLLSVNWETKVWLWKGRQYTCQPGQLVTSLPSLAQQTNSTVQTVRSALAKMKKLGILTDESIRQGRLITLTNWGSYQSDESTDESTATKDVKEIKNKKEEGGVTATPTTERPAGEKRKRAYRLPEDWQPDDKLLAWASEKHPHIDCVLQTERFKNHHISKGTRYINWGMTWQNWVMGAFISSAHNQKPFASRLPVKTFTQSGIIEL